jgi:hypothetical protein
LKALESTGEASESLEQRRLILIDSSSPKLGRDGNKHHSFSKHGLEHMRVIGK